jgi:hypothetical protein
MILQRATIARTTSNLKDLHVKHVQETFAAKQEDQATTTGSK